MEKRGLSMRSGLTAICLCWVLALVALTGCNVSPSGVASTPSVESNTNGDGVSQSGQESQPVQVSRDVDASVPAWRRSDADPVAVYNINSEQFPEVDAFLESLEAAKQKRAALDGSVESVWTYVNALDAIDAGALIAVTSTWQRAEGFDEVSAESKAGYAIDGRIVYAHFRSLESESQTSCYYDGEGGLMYMVRAGGDTCKWWSFANGELLSYRKGWPGIDVQEPRVVGEWDEVDRLAEQERQFRFAQRDYELLRVDEMIAVDGP